MVAALNRQHLRVVLDVVYNHTADAGQTGTNDLDRIVPGYYHRLDATGRVQTSTCCPDTATEHTMMGKLVVDSVLTWATAVQGGRLPLRPDGPSPQAEPCSTSAAALDRLTPAQGRRRRPARSTSTARAGTSARWPTTRCSSQATQANMAGTGIGTFNDRLRDAVRGGGPFDTNPRIQGFGSGQYTDPNGDPVNGDAAAQKATLLHDEDLVKVGLAGNLKDYTLHRPRRADGDRRRSRLQRLTRRLHRRPAGGDHLRRRPRRPDACTTRWLSSCRSRPRWPTGSGCRPCRWPPRHCRRACRSGRPAPRTCAASPSTATATTPATGSTSSTGPTHGNGFGRGLPPAASNSAMWPYEKPLLADPALKPTPADILSALGSIADAAAAAREHSAVPPGSAPR